MWLLSYIPRPVWLFLGWVCLIGSIIFAIVAVPLGEALGEDIEQWNIHGLNQSASYRNDPGRARAEVPDFSAYTKWIALGVALFLILGFGIALLTAHRAKSKKK